MSIAQIDGWRLPGCGPDCIPRRHDPEAHEQHGYHLGIEAARPKIVTVGVLTVDLSRNRARVTDREIHLSPQEWGVLAHLARNVGRHCSSPEIVRAVWGDSYLGPGASRLVTTVMYRVRASLGDAGGLIVNHMNGRGYVLVDLDAPLPVRPWSMRNSACTACGRSERPHFSREMCVCCYQRWYRSHGGEPLS